MTMHAERTRRRVGSRAASGCFLIACLALLAGCGGGRYIKIDLSRPADLSQPVWVGTYFLSQDSALDLYTNAELVDPDLEIDDGVIHKEVFPLYPGDASRHIELTEPSQQIRCVVVAAGIPDAPPCARQKVAVPAGAKLAIAVTVSAGCVDVRVD